MIDTLGAKPRIAWSKPQETKCGWTRRNLLAVGQCQSAALAAGRHQCRIGRSSDTGTIAALAWPTYQPLGAAP